MPVFTVLLRVGHDCFYSVTKSGSCLFLQCYQEWVMTVFTVLLRVGHASYNS